MQPTAMYTKDRDRCIATNTSRGTGQYGIRVEAQGLDTSRVGIRMRIKAQVELAYE